MELGFELIQNCTDFNGFASDFQKALDANRTAATCRIFSSVLGLGATIYEEASKVNKLEQINQVYSKGIPDYKMWLKPGNLYKPFRFNVTPCNCV